MSFKSDAQTNLVTNPSFEHNGNYQNGGIGAFGWKKPPNDGNTPDRFTNGSLTNCLGGCLQGQNTFAGDTYAFAGEKFVGGLAYYIQGGQQNGREYIHQELYTELIAGHVYSIGFVVKFGSRSKYIINSFGMFISDTAIGPSNVAPLHDIIPVTPQLNLNIPFGDSSEWTQLSMDYTALGGEKFITIGNFTPDSLLNISINPLNDPNDNHILTKYGSYFFIDSVFIVDYDTTSANASVPELKNFLDFKMYPNPTSDIVNIKIKDGVRVDEILLLDLQGRRIANFPPKQRTLNIFDIASGEYFLHVKTEFGTVIEKLRIE